MNKISNHSQKTATHKNADKIITQGLRVQNLNHKYKDITILKNINININKGEIVGLLGPNGAGKTTSFYFIIGMLRKATAGQVILDGKDITKFPMYQRAKLGIGYLPQDASVFRGLSVQQNIKAVLEIKQYDKNTQNRKIEELLKEFALVNLRDAPAQSLSGGERRKLEIARLLATEPEFILQDEPLAGIDPIAIQDIKNLIRQLKTKNIGILISDHNVRETLKIVDRAYILYKGEIIIEGTPSEIQKSPTARKLYLGDDF